MAAGPMPGTGRPAFDIGVLANLGRAMKVKKAVTVVMDDGDDWTVRIGGETLRIVKLKAHSEDRARYVWCWYESDGVVELQQVSIAALPVTVMRLLMEATA